MEPWLTRWRLGTRRVCSTPSESPTTRSRRCALTSPSDLRVEATNTTVEFGSLGFQTEVPEPGASLGALVALGSLWHGGRSSAADDTPRPPRRRRPLP